MDNNQNNVINNGDSNNNHIAHTAMKFSKSKWMSRNNKKWNNMLDKQSDPETFYFSLREMHDVEYMYRT